MRCSGAWIWYFSFYYVDYYDTHQSQQIGNTFKSIPKMSLVKHLHQYNEIFCHFYLVWT